MSQEVGHRWRDYRSESGRRPVREFLDALAREDHAEIVGAMAEIREHGLVAARHLRGEIYEVRADAAGGSYRVLFASEGTKGRILLALVAFAKTSRRTPPHSIDLALRRLRDWHARGG